jgi:hypothetical protein
MEKLSSSKIFRKRKKKRDIDHGVLVADDVDDFDEDADSVADGSSFFSSPTSPANAQQNTENHFRWSVKAERSTGTTPLERVAAEEDGSNDDDDIYINESSTGTSKKTKKKDSVKSSKSKASKGNSSKKDKKKSKSRKHESKPFRVETEYEVEESEKTNEKLEKVKHKHKKREGKGKRKPSEKSIDDNLLGDLPDARSTGSPRSALAGPGFLNNSIGSKIRMSLAHKDKFGHSPGSSKSSLSLAALPQTLPAVPPLNTSNPSQTDDNSTNVNTVDGRALKQKIVPKIRTFAVMLGLLNSQREFDAAFKEDSGEEEDKNNLKQNDKKRQKHPQKSPKEEQRVDRKLKELEKERKGITKERNAIQLERESFEQLLDTEMSKNFDLESKIQALEEELNNVLSPHQVTQLKEQSEMLRTENKVLKQHNARHEATISSLHGQKASREKNHSHLYSSNHSSTAGSVTEVRPPNNDASESLLGDVVHELHDDDDSDFLTVDSRGAQGGAKVQGELLQLRSSLTRKTSALEIQAKEIANLREELKTSREHQGVQKMKVYIQNLEAEKKYFVDEIGRLKKDLQEATKQSGKSKDSGGWFGFGGSRSSAQNDKVNAPYNDILGLSQPPVEIAEGALDNVPEKRLSNILNF